MALNATQLADEVRSAMGFPLPTSPKLIGWAQGIVEEIQQNGIATSGGFAGPHSISGITGASMASKVASYAGYPSISPELLGFCNGVVLHIMAMSKVFYIDPPTFIAGGTIVGTNGPAMATQVQALVPYPLITTQLLAECTAISNHINANATVNAGIIS